MIKHLTNDSVEFMNQLAEDFTRDHDPKAYCAPVPPARAIATATAGRPLLADAFSRDARDAKPIPLTDDGHRVRLFTFKA